MTHSAARCLILACGNTLRQDDGVGPWLSAWAEDRFASDPSVSVIGRQQWTPDLAENLAQARAVFFIDCSIESAPGEVRLVPVEPIAAGPGLASHHFGAAELLSLGKELYGSLPLIAQFLTVGAGSIELGEDFSPEVTAALPHACELLEKSVRQALALLSLKT